MCTLLGEECSLSGADTFRAQNSPKQPNSCSKHIGNTLGGPWKVYRVGPRWDPRKISATSRLLWLLGCERYTNFSLSWPNRTLWDSQTLLRLLWEPGLHLLRATPFAPGQHFALESVLFPGKWTYFPLECVHFPAKCVHSPKESGHCATHIRCRCVTGSM